MLFDRQAGRPWRSVRIAGGSGRRSRRDSRVKMRYLSRECRPPWGHVGSGRRAACHQRGLHHHRSRLRGGTCCSRSGRRSRCCGPKGMACGRSPAAWSGPHRPSPGSCGGMPPPAGAVWTIGRRAVARRPLGRRQPAKLAVNPALRQYVQDRLAGTVVAPDGAAVHGPAVTWKGRRHGPRQDGPRRGAPNRSLGACGSTIRRTRRCASAMRPSTRRCSFKAAEPCAAT